MADNAITSLFTELIVDDEVKMTDEIEALRERIVATLGEVFEQPGHGVRVLFAEDPEGALTENVQMSQG